MVHDLAEPERSRKVARVRRALGVGLALVATGAVLVGAAVLLQGPSGPAALPPGATPLALLTQPPRLWPPSGFGCPAALVPPIRVERDGSALVFTRVDVRERVSVVWPSGFSARLVNGRAELVYPDGSVLARERDVISNLEGGSADNGDILVCISFASHPEVDRAP